jgi:predicted  nucleic acid-binding Zn-ribbon protein
MLERLGCSRILHPDATEPTWIRACCRDCGEVRFQSSLARLHADTDAGTVRLSFPCPKCGVRSARRLPPSAVNQVRQAGVPIRLLTRPAEADEVHAGPPLNDLDAAEFARQLEQQEWDANFGCEKGI